GNGPDRPARGRQYYTPRPEWHSYPGQRATRMWQEPASNRPALPERTGMVTYTPLNLASAKMFVYVLRIYFWFTTFLSEAKAPGGCGGMELWAKGISSSECIGFPAGSMMVGVMKIMRFFLDVFFDSVRKNRPKKGRSPSTGTLSLMLVTFSEMRPPRATVWPSQTLTVETTWRTRKRGKMVGTTVAPPMRLKSTPWRA